MESLADDPEVEMMANSAITVKLARLPITRRSRRIRDLPDPVGQREELGLKTMPTVGRGDCVINAVAGSSNTAIEPVDCRRNVATILLEVDAATTFDAFCARGEDIAAQAAYIRVPGNWFCSIHIAALVILIQRSIAVVSVDGFPINLYGLDARWCRLTTAELRALMHGSYPPVIVALDNTNHGLEHFLATKSRV
jgi:hypothetical protein